MCVCVYPHACVCVCMHVGMPCTLCLSLPLSVLVCMCVCVRFVYSFLFSYNCNLFKHFLCVYLTLNYHMFSLIFIHLCVTLMICVFQSKFPFKDSKVLWGGRVLLSRFAGETDFA